MKKPFSLFLFFLCPFVAACASERAVMSIQKYHDNGTTENSKFEAVPRLESEAPPFILTDKKTYINYVFTGTTIGFKPKTKAGAVSRFGASVSYGEVFVKIQGGLKEKQEIFWLYTPNGRVSCIDNNASFKVSHIEGEYGRTTIECLNGAIRCIPISKDYGVLTDLKDGGIVIFELKKSPIIEEEIDNNLPVLSPNGEGNL